MKNELKNAIEFRNPVKIQVFDKDGNLKHETSALNGVVDTGIEHMLDRTFNSATDEPTWYIGLMNASPTLDPSDTILAAGHSGWTEFTAYSSPATRQTWSNGAASSRAVTNATTADFTISGGASTVSGIFVCTESTISGPGTGEILWATAEFASAASVTGGDTLKVTYTVSG